MARVSTYLNFVRETEAAFNFYKTVFNSDYTGGGIMRYSDMIPPEDGSKLPDADKNLIVHIELPILDGHILMGSDAPESMQFKVSFGNNSYIMLEPDTKEETGKLFTLLSEGGIIIEDLQEMFWGGLYGSLTDKFGVKWMFNCSEKPI
jgi:PhnB protein